MWWVDLRSILCCFATSHAMCTRWSNCDSLCLQEWCYSSVPVKTTSPCWSSYYISVVPRQHMSVPWTDDTLNVPTIKLQNNVNLSPNTFAGLHFHIYLCLHAGVYVNIYICMYVYYAYMNTHMHICMYDVWYIYIYVCVCVLIKSQHPCSSRGPSWGNFCTSCQDVSVPTAGCLAVTFLRGETVFYY